MSEILMTPPPTWDGWEHMGTFCECDIYRQWTNVFARYYWGSPCAPSLYWNRYQVEDYIESQGYCSGTPPPPSPEGRASIIEVSFPSELEAGNRITGYVRVKNVGEVEDKIQSVIVTPVDGDRDYNETLNINGTLTHTIPSYFGIVMPDGDTVITIIAYHDEGGSWVEDDRRTHVISQPPPPVEGEGRASVIEVSLPDALNAGDVITGTIRAMNIGTGDSNMRSLVTTMWNGREYRRTVNLPVNGVLTHNLPSFLGITMPNQDAVIRIEGQHEENGVWITDDTKTH